ncbi:TetR/AcrR family transcriptional regulator [Paracidovorax wautersii]|jgi:AcrR family transcriptional regulator|uniref:DNA-binding transcriptional regulator, AcrR family n=1 Tax=Paracidovorax wautersii TaxID=1177982 RepID=A0A1I2E023_9BURK|nr:TetR/AcrR family transcriptional regulator [Paracidovorax wautersii]GAO20749.1 TetR family transcriptional regulator [Alicycliphilus sp. B1]SFE85933.1 DNA-binding transcriptional regulator, AcrR family [Paracidovorax wautersii]
MQSKSPKIQRHPPAAAVGGASERPLGLRERHKLDKLRRIQSAARKVFLEKGFDAATTREVAEIAEVSHATVFLYAKDKRDLLFLVFNDDLDRVAEEALAAVDHAKPLLHQLLQLFGPFYQYFANDPQIGLVGIHQYGTAATGGTPQMQRVQQRSEATLQAISASIDACKAAGSVAARVGTAPAAHVIRAIYLSEMDRWLHTTDRDVDAGLRSLRAALRLVFEGLREHA